MAVARLQAALNLDEVVIGGGNAKEPKQLPRGVASGITTNAFLGGFRLWQNPGADPASRGSGNLAREPARKRITRKRSGIFTPCDRG